MMKEKSKKEINKLTTKTTEVTLNTNWYNIRSKKEISTDRLMQLNSIIGDIASLHYGLKWLYVVDSKKPGKFDILLNNQSTKVFAKELSLSEVKEHLETILKTLQLHNEDLKIADAWILSTIKREVIKWIYHKVKGETGTFTQRAEESILKTITGEYQI